MAKVVDGVYDAADGAIRLISSPDITKEKYEEFSRLIKNARSEKLSLSELEKTAHEIDPRFGDAIKLAKGMPAAWAFLILMGWWISNWDVKLDINRLIDQLSPQVSVEKSIDNNGVKKPKSNQKTQGSAPARKSPGNKHRKPESRRLIQTHLNLLGQSSSPYLKPSV